MKNLEIPKESSEDKIHSIVKGALGAVPLVGALISEAFGLIFSQPITKRREKWMAVVVDELKKLEKEIDNFSIENLRNDEEFVTFLIEASQIAFKTHQDKKLKYLQNSLGNYYKVQFEFDKKYSFLRIIDDLSPTHLDMLVFISKNGSHIIEKIKGFSDLLELYSKDHESLDRYYFRKCVRDLESASLIRINRDFQDFIGGGSFATDESAPSIKLLEYGEELIKYLIEYKS